MIFAGVRILTLGRGRDRRAEYRPQGHHECAVAALGWLRLEAILRGGLARAGALCGLRTNESARCFRTRGLVALTVAGT
jgi:hypothetical protein